VPGRQVTEAELLELCRAKLGSIVGPKSVDFIDALPRSAIGKVLKRELRDRFIAEHSASPAVPKG